MDQKQKARTEARARRVTLTWTAFADHVAAFAKDLDLPKGAIVAGYHPIRDEADPRALMSALSALGHPLALPCVVAARSALVFRKWKMGDPMAPNTYGIAEPLASAPEVMPGAVLVPLLAFDAEGHRLGYGGGYYDRTFDRLPGMRLIGVAYAGQEVATVPREEHDHPLDMVVTENGIRRFYQT
ncbi:MAG: 5-formyltetrahydrofolate cyclo-ligase [Rhizomicrobium sp.]